MPTLMGKLQVIAEDGTELNILTEQRGGRLCCTLGSGSYRLICR